MEFLKDILKLLFIIFFIVGMIFIIKEEAKQKEIYSPCRCITIQEDIGML